MSENLLRLNLNYDQVNYLLSLLKGKNDRPGRALRALIRNEVAFQAIVLNP